MVIVLFRQLIGSTVYDLVAKTRCIYALRGLPIAVSYKRAVLESILYDMDTGRGLNSMRSIYGQTLLINFKELV